MTYRAPPLPGFRRIAVSLYLRLKQVCGGIDTTVAGHQHRVWVVLDVLRENRVVVGEVHVNDLVAESQKQDLVAQLSRQSVEE